MKQAEPALDQVDSSHVDSSQASRPAERVLVLAPLGRDGTLACEVLAGAGLDCVVCPDAADFRRELLGGVGAALLTEEALSSETREVLRGFLEAQPAWSDLPLAFINGARRGERSGRGTAHAKTSQATLQALGPRRNVTLLERPLRPLTLITVMQSALRARRRQYEVRDLLAQLQEANAHLEGRVSERTSEVRRLATQLTLAEGRERNRVAQALHDELQQQLVAVQFPLSSLRKRFSGEDAEVLKEVSELLKGAITTTRQVTSDLSPPVLRGEGLVEALRWLTRRLEARFGLRVSLEAEGATSVPDEAVRALLFSLVRELLFNIAKHAGIDHATLTVREAEDVLTLTVADGGKGFDLAVLDVDGDGTGLGLRSARERLQLFGGDITVASQPGDGTHVTITVPVSALTLD